MYYAYFGLGSFFILVFFWEMFETKLKKLEGKKKHLFKAEIAGDYRCLSVEAATCIISWIYCKTFYSCHDRSIILLFIFESIHCFCLFLFKFLFYSSKDIKFTKM